MTAPRQFTKVSAAVWSSKRFRSVSESAQLLHLYLMTSSHQNSTGAFRAPVGYISVDMGWPGDRVDECLAELVGADLIARDADEDELFVRDWFRFNPPMNGKHAAGTVTLLRAIKSETLRALVTEEFNAASAADPVVSASIEARNRLAETNYVRGRRGG